MWPIHIRNLELSKYIFSLTVVCAIEQLFRENQSTSRKRGDIIIFDLFTFTICFYLSRNDCFSTFFAIFFAKRKNNGRASFNFYLKSAAITRSRVLVICAISPREREASLSNGVVKGKSERPSWEKTDSWTEAAS